jgi:hypothetical protein
MEFSDVKAYRNINYGIMYFLGSLKDMSLMDSQDCRGNTLPCSEGKDWNKGLK